MKKKQQIRRDKPRKRECLPQYIVNHRHRRASWLDVSRVITEIKQRVLSEKDPLKRQIWAEVGVQLNGMFLRIESYKHFNI